MPRLSAWHLSHYHRSRSPSPSDRWQRDTLLQFCRNLLDTHASVELASIHPYVHYNRSASHANISAAGNGENGDNGDGGAVGGASSLDARHYSQALRAPTSLSFMNENLPLIDVVKYAQQCIASNPSPRPKQLYVGEFGYRQGDNVTLQFVRDVLAMAAAPPSRTGSAELPSPSSSSSSSLTAGGWKPVLPPLVTLWVYEFKPQAETLSVELHRDAGLISEVATANARAFKQ